MAEKSVAEDGEDGEQTEPACEEEKVSSPPLSSDGKADSAGKKADSDEKPAKAVEEQADDTPSAVEQYEGGSSDEEWE